MSTQTAELRQYEYSASTENEHSMSTRIPQRASVLSAHECSLPYGDGARARERSAQRHPEGVGPPRSTQGAALTCGRRRGISCAGRGRITGGRIMSKFNVGDEITIRSQTFRAVRFVPYTTKDNRQVELLVWESRCADCGKTFEHRTTGGGRGPGDRRRCDGCKSPGKPVGGLRQHHVRALARRKAGG